MKSAMGLTSAALLLLCGGCSTGVNGESVMGRAGSPAWLALASPETQRAHFEAVCSGYGFTPGTPQMTACIMEETRTARDRAETRRLAAGAALGDLSNAYLSAGRDTVTCNTYGNTTTCY